MRFVLVASFVCMHFCLCASSEAQEVRKALRDYRDDRVFNYSPNDPWYRGKLFNVQTKHYGKFYNCDGEEAKRNSPYICWKPHTDNDFPPFVRTIDCIREDLGKVRQRIADGSCAQDNCSCQECQQQFASSDGTSLGMQTLLSAKDAGQATTQRKQSAGIPYEETHQASSQYGLVKGKIIPEASQWVEKEATAQVAKPRATVARSHETSSRNFFRKR